MQGQGVDCDEAILVVGQEADPALAKYLEEEFGVKGLIEIYERTRQIRGRPKVYAGGDIVRGAGTIVEAVGDGRKAARAIDLILKGEVVI